MATRNYLAKYIHRTSPRPDDVSGPHQLNDSAFSNRTTLAKAMRKAGILMSGERLRTFRVEGDKVITFPSPPSPWHSITLIESDAEQIGVDYPGYKRVRR